MSKDSTTARHAIYFSPERGSLLGSLGAAWLGRDCVTGAKTARPGLVGISPSRAAEITASAGHYGFHATLKPPFVLAEGRTRAELDRELARFAERRAPITGLGLQVGVLGGFLALLLTEYSGVVHALAASCVREFDSFRVAPSKEELCRRRSGRLSAREDALLRRWGYPYVMESFRFHMTLTSRLQEEERNRLLPVLQQMFGPAIELGFTIDAVSLFYQESRDEPFHLVRRYPFSGSARSAATKEDTERSSGPSLTIVKTSLPST